MSLEPKRPNPTVPERDAGGLVWVVVALVAGCVTLVIVMALLR